MSSKHISMTRRRTRAFKIRAIVAAMEMGEGRSNLEDPFRDSRSIANRGGQIERDQDRGGSARAALADV